jgi:phosphate-selective porin OprO/OprP
MARGGRPDEGQLRLKAKPGATLAPNFLDTGKFASDWAGTWGVEAYYRSGPWIYGGEYDWQQADVAGGSDAHFHGGDLTVVWLATGETRSYNAPGGYFNQVIPEKSVFEGGHGAVEATLTLTYSDFEDRGIDGGKFWRITPMAKWFLTAGLWFEAAYGYGELDRFGLRGTTQFFQGRFVSVL